MTIDDLLQPVLNTGTPLKTSDTPSTVASWDSLAQINIIAAIEDLIGGELSTDEVLRLNSVSGVIAVCRARGVMIDAAG